MPTLSIQHHTVGGIRTWVRTGGPTPHSEEAVVFVHGNPGSSADFSDLLTPTAEFARVIAPDMPGYGRSERPRDFSYTVHGYADHLDRLLTELGVKRAHLVLHDFGGPWGLQWAADHPEQVASLTLLNVGLLVGYKWHKFARLWRTPVLGELFQLGASRKAFGALLNADNPKPFPDSFIDRMFDDADWPMKQGVLKLYRATSDPSGHSEAIGEILKPYQIRTLVLWGDGDRYLPVSMAEKQRAYFDAEVHVLPGCGHWPMIDEPETVRKLVVPFLRERYGQSSQAVG